MSGRRSKALRRAAVPIVESYGEHPSAPSLRRVRRILQRARRLNLALLAGVGRMVEPRPPRRTWPAKQEAAIARGLSDRDAKQAGVELLARKQRRTGEKLLAGKTARLFGFAP